MKHTHSRMSQSSHAASSGVWQNSVATLQVPGFTWVPAHPEQYVKKKKRLCWGQGQEKERRRNSPRKNKGPLRYLFLNSHCKISPAFNNKEKHCLVGETRGCSDASGYVFARSVSLVPCLSPWVTHSATVHMNGFTIHPQRFRNRGNRPKREGGALLVQGKALPRHRCLSLL